MPIRSLHPSTLPLRKEGYAWYIQAQSEGEMPRPPLRTHLDWPRPERQAPLQVEAPAPLCYLARPLRDAGLAGVHGRVAQR